MHLEVQEVGVPRTLQVWLPSDPDQPPTQAFPTSLLMDFLGSSLFLILPPAMTVNPLKTIYLISGDLEESHHLQPKDFYSNPMEP